MPYPLPSMRAMYIDVRLFFRKRRWPRVAWPTMMGLCLAFVQSYAFASPIAATFAPIAQLVREVAPKADLICLVQASDPHLIQLTPAAAMRAKTANMLFAEGVLDAGWRPAHARTIVLFDDDPHGWLNPQRLPEALHRIAKALHQPPADVVAEELQRWQALLARHRIRAVVLQHEAWRAWFAALGVDVLAVLDAHGIGAHTTTALSSALTRAKRHAGHLLLIGEPHRPQQGLQWLAEHLDPRPPIVWLDPIGRCDETWRQHMQRVRSVLAKALAELR